MDVQSVRRVPCMCGSVAPWYFPSLCSCTLLPNLYCGVSQFKLCSRALHFFQKGRGLTSHLPASFVRAPVEEPSPPSVDIVDNTRRGWCSHGSSPGDGAVTMGSHARQIAVLSGAGSSNDVPGSLYAASSSPVFSVPGGTELHLCLFPRRGI